jgi:hypothetical protein
MKPLLLLKNEIPQIKILIMTHGKVKYPPLTMVVLTIRIICALIAKLTLEIIQIIWLIIIILESNNQSRENNRNDWRGGGCGKKRGPLLIYWRILMKILIH